MARFDIRNPNGSLVFVRGTRVKPYANFSANLDNATARELVKYGVSLTEQKAAKTTVSAPVVVAPATPAVVVATPVVDLLPLMDVAAAVVHTQLDVAFDTDMDNTFTSSVAEEPVAEEPVAEEPVAEEPVAEEPVAEEPVAEEPVAEEPVAGGSSRKRGRPRKS